MYRLVRRGNAAAKTIVVDQCDTKREGMRGIGFRAAFA